MPPRAVSVRSRLGKAWACVAAVAIIGACTTTAPTTAPTRPSGPAPSAIRTATPGTTGPEAPVTPTEGRTSGPGSPAVDWRDPGLPVEARVDALLAGMTVDEKIGQMTLIEKDSIDPDGVAEALVGGVLSGGGGTPGSNTPEAWLEMVGAYQEAALGTRLGIPVIYGIDAVHGHGNAYGATIFPQNIGLGAADDPDLVEAIGRATALEMSATGVRWDFAPVVAVAQDVRWGRTYEGYGEDTALVGRLGAAFIRGLQGTDLSEPDTAVATAKHFLADGGTAWGSSTTPGYRIDRGVTDVDDETLRAIHLPPYEEAIAAGVRTVMATQSSTRAGKVHGDSRLLTDVLKTDLGFTGFVVSDWAGVDQVVPDDYDSAVAQSISAGIDMVMVPYDAALFQDALRTGLEAGSIAQERVDDAVWRILRVKFEMGLFEQPMPPPGRGDVLGSPEHRDLARRAVADSLVLLRTDPDALPLDPDGTVLLAGPGADDIGLASGGWTIEWQGAVGDITPGTTLLEALRSRLGDRLVYDEGAGFPDGAAADVGIVVVAEPPYAEGEGDSPTLALPPAHVALVGEMRDRVDTLIVIVYSGRPVVLDEILADADAVVAAWLPGTETDGIADVLLGDVPFSGTTPYTWPASPDDAPRTGKEPCQGAVFPLGFGLDASGTEIGTGACPAP